MADVIPFGNKKSPNLAPDAGIVDANGQKVQTARTLQNDIIQRRNFLLLDMATGEMVLPNNNYVQANLAIGHILPSIQLHAMEQISGSIATQVLKQFVGQAPAEDQPDEVPPPEAHEETHVEDQPQA